MVTGSLRMAETEHAAWQLPAATRCLGWIQLRTRQCVLAKTVINLLPS